MATLVREQPAYAQALCALGMADAALGHKEDAIREGRRAVELLPVTKDSINGALLVQYLALIYAWTGEKDLAFEQLATRRKRSRVFELWRTSSTSRLRRTARRPALRQDRRLACAEIKAIASAAAASREYR